MLSAEIIRQLNWPKFNLLFFFIRTFSLFKFATCTFFCVFSFRLLPFTAQTTEKGGDRNFCYMNVFFASLWWLVLIFNSVLHFALRRHKVYSYMIRRKSSVLLAKTKRKKTTWNRRRDQDQVEDSKKGKYLQTHTRETDKLNLRRKEIKKLAKAFISIFYCFLMTLLLPHGSVMLSYDGKYWGHLVFRFIPWMHSAATKWDNYSPIWVENSFEFVHHMRQLG